MSNYKSITKHPQTGTYELAEWVDNYYGPHLYGCRFESDGKVYPRDLVERAQIYDFWIEDVIEAFKKITNWRNDEPIVDLLNEIQNQYKLRWERDPETGEGATEKSRVVKRHAK